MQFVLIDQTGDSRIMHDSLIEVAASLTKQCVQHFCPSWEASAPSIAVADTLDAAPSNAWPIVLIRHAEQAGILGYHDVTPDGRPYSRVFTDPVFDAGEDFATSHGAVSTVISHELLEAIADPYVDFWIDYDAAREVAFEVCDPVEADSYAIDGVSVSNFITPRWARLGPGPYDWMQRLNAPLSMSSGGYLITRTGGPSGTRENVFGSTYPEWKKAGKTFAAARSWKRTA